MCCIKESFMKTWHIFWATLSCQGQANNEWVTRHWLRQKKKYYNQNKNHLSIFQLIFQFQLEIAVLNWYVIWCIDHRQNLLEMDQYVNVCTILLETYPLQQGPWGTLNVGQLNTHLVKLGHEGAVKCPKSIKHASRNICFIISQWSSCWAN